jgi:adenylate cyclase
MATSIRLDASDKPYQAFAWASNPDAEWLILEAWHLPDTQALLGELCRRLLGHGMPIWRVVLSARAMHPQLFGRTITWERGCDCTIERERFHGIESSPEYLESPVRVIYEGAGALRRRLEGDDAVLDFPILKELKAQGATDYVIMPLETRAGGRNFISWDTDQPGGFSAECLSLLYDLLPAIAVVSELFATRRMGRDLLNVYLGKDAAQKVLAGEIRRGKGTNMPAVLMYCDLAGFTSLSDHTPGEAIIALLDDYYEAMARPVEARGGEVLKFIGDAMLAVFKVEGQGAETAASAAFEAALEATKAIDGLNRIRAQAGEDWLASKIVLHAGDVMYGNVGAADRLDFTVIGPAVNALSRIEPYCESLDEPLLTTGSFAKLVPGPLVSRGRHRLEDVREAAELFAPRESLDLLRKDRGSAPQVSSSSS